MNSHDIDKSYISPIDAFLTKFDLTHELSLSQELEMVKHQRIAALRDSPQHHAVRTSLLDDF